MISLGFRCIFVLVRVGGNGPAYKTAEEYYDEVIELKKVLKLNVSVWYFTCIDVFLCYEYLAFAF